MTRDEIVTSLRACANKEFSDCGKCACKGVFDNHRTCADNLKILAADALGTLLNRCARYAEKIAALQERQRWIPVTERLPEDRSDVLVVAYWHERWGVYMGWCAPERAEWSVHIGIGDRGDVAVTHWMPLPEAPEVE